MVVPEAFAAASHFKRAVLSSMAWGLTQRERLEVRDLFLSIDQDGSGYIDFAEFNQLISDHYPHVKNEEVQRLFKALDQNRDEKIYYSDFLASMLQFRVSVHETLLRHTFNRFDKDGSG